VVAQLIEQLIHVSQSFTSDERQKVGNLGLLDQAEQQHIIEDWNPSYPDSEAKLSIQQRFEEQVLIQPEKIALAFENEKLSYEELNRRVNRLAHKLIAQNIGPDILVGIAIKRSVSMIVAVLAVLKTGGAYVPLDPSYPEDRLSYMAENSGLSLLLTQRELSAQLALSAKVKSIYLDDDNEINNDCERSNPSYRAHSKNLAYLIYTSGTTGLPKGVGIDHGSFSRHVEVYSKRLGLTKDDCILQYATLNFDTFAEQLFPTLCCGATVVLRGEDIWDNDTFYNNLLHYGISVANLTPSMWYQLFKYFSAQGLTGFGRLRRMIVGGEAMPLDGLALWQELGLSKAELWNFYGPTEATAASTSFCCNVYFNGEESIPTTVPIGQTLAGRFTYIVDNNLNLVPPGVTGELVIGGDLLARGYHSRVNLTAERFIADPFNQEGGRLYRSGDLAKYRSDGTIEYAGRIDHQVKIRGFRIELGEIESQLQSHDDIRDAVVLAQEVNTSQQLVTYVIPNDTKLTNTDIDSDEDTEANIEKRTEAQHAFRAQIKAQLQQSLPDYMVPTHILFLEEFPLTPNGKLDRKALPQADANQLQQRYEAPQTTLEKQLAEIWQEVLGVEQVGLTDNFFELGGHSLLVIRVVTGIKNKTSHIVSMSDFMFRPTIKLLTEFLCNDKKGYSTPIVRLNTYEGKASPLFCIHAAGGSAYPFYSLALKLNEQRPVLGIMSRSYIESDWLADSWQGMVEDYVTQIRSHQANGPYLLLGWSLGGALAIDIAYQLELQGEDVNFLGLLDSSPTSAKEIELNKDFYNESMIKVLEHESVSNVDKTLDPEQLNVSETFVDLITEKNLHFVANIFPSIEFELLISQYSEYTNKGLAAESVRNEIISWVAKQENVLSHQIESILDNYRFEEEMGIVDKVYDHLGSLQQKSFVFKTLNIKLDCWWANLSQKESDIEYLEHFISRKNKGATFNRIDADHESIVHNDELLQSIEHRLSDK
jgi:amino acid adenylation domain-containing protein